MADRTGAGRDEVQRSGARPAGAEPAGIEPAGAEPAGIERATVGTVPRWLPVTGLALTAAGLAVSGYLTVEHFSSTSALACPNTGTLDCEKVTTSEQSKIFGIPMAILGLGYFAALTVLLLPAAWRLADPRVRQLRLLTAGVGVCFVLYLIYAELFVINAICLWCTVVHVLTFALFCLVAIGTALTPVRRP